MHTKSAFTAGHQAGQAERGKRRRLAVAQVRGATRSSSCRREQQLQSCAGQPHQHSAVTTAAPWPVPCTPPRLQVWREDCQGQPLPAQLLQVQHARLHGQEDRGARQQHRRHHRHRVQGARVAAPHGCTAGAIPAAGAQPLTLPRSQGDHNHAMPGSSRMGGGHGGRQFRAPKPPPRMDPAAMYMVRVTPAPCCAASAGQLRCPACLPAMHTGSVSCSLLQRAHAPEPPRPPPACRSSLRRSSSSWRPAWA